MLQLLRLLLYLAAGAVIFVPGAQSSYFESAASCGYAATGFVHFEQSPELLNEKERSLGVCGWGFADEYALRPQVKNCLACSFTPADQPSCTNGATLVPSPVWYLAPQQDCQWQGCFLGDMACSNGTVASTALCDDGRPNVRCCRFKPYIRCCSAVACTYRSSPAGQCVVGERDLLPGQQSVGRLFAVSAASTDCFQYSFQSSRICSSDRTFVPELAYETCETRAVSRDSEGCVKVPGYTFHPGVQIDDASNWRIDDGTQWGRLENAAAAQQAAARDMLLMASRCSSVDTCAGFQNTGVSTDLLYQLPTSSNWVSVQQSADTRCHGIYEKTPPWTGCPRVSGYLFIPMRTLDTASSSSSGFTAPAGGGSCATCANSTTLASRCDADPACVGFSHYHGLLARSAGSATSTTPRPLLADAPTVQFTTTPCAGMFVRAAGAFPLEVEQLDRLLCGERVYCTSTQLRYHATSQFSPTSGSYYVDLVVDILTDLTLPRGVADAAAAGGLRPLPSVRSLTLRCRNGASLLGGLPAGLATLTPLLQELRVVGCAAAGPLPPALAALRYLRVLDVSGNALTGSLPGSWANMTLGYLNLSRNALTGTLPGTWRGILTPRAAAAVPPPPPPAAAAVPPPPSSRRRRVAQATAQAAAAAAGSQSDMLVADLSANSLEGPVDREYVYDSCVRRGLRMQLRGEPAPELAGGFGLPTFLLQYNPGVAAWAGRYSLADLGTGGGGSNLCGSVGYKVALGVLWGVFGACLLAIAAWSALSAWKAARAARRGRFFIADVGGPSPAQHASATSTSASEPDSASCSPAAACASLPARAAAAAAALWRRRWVRRATLLLRIGYLLADVALDVRVIVWLFAEGDATSSAVCLGFLLATQMVVSAALLASLSHHLFASRLTAAALSPLLLALGPVAGPVLAVANMRNSDVPLVFWRYLELVEFCVALLQAPAESVTQSLVYARLNRLGNGMYMQHGLFLASIILSMGDMIITVLKLCRYKRGPFRRLLIALTHLDRERDPVDYRKPLLSSSLDGSQPLGDGGANDGYAPHDLDAPLNPPGGAGSRLSPNGTNRGQLREGAGPLPVSPPGGGAGGGEAAAAGASGAGGEAATPMLELSPREEREEEGVAAAMAGDGERAAVTAAVAAAAAHTFTPLTTLRYRPSLLSASSQRLGGGSGHHAIGVPSRLGPGGAAARGGVLAGSAHPPLRPSMANLPSTPKGARAAGDGSGSGDAEASSSAQARAWAAAETAGEEGGLARRSRGLQAALASESLASQPPLAGGSISLEAYGSAATGGHGPPAQPGGAAAPEAQLMLRSSASGSVGATAAAAAAGGPFSHASEPPPRAGGAAAALELPPLSPPADPRLFSAAAAVQAALSGAGVPPAPVSRGPGGAAAAATAAAQPPERLVLGASGAGAPTLSVSSSVKAREAAGEGGARALRHVASAIAASSPPAGSVPAPSPARRREVPALSIAVPVSPVQAQGIEVIRVLTPGGSSRHLSPQTSRGAPTPVGMLPPPPQQQQLQHLLQQERLDRQRQQQQQLQQQPEQGQAQQAQAQPGGPAPPLPPTQPPGG